jgi:4-hydroxybenzoyl-CoA reductase subunit alpha
MGGNASKMAGEDIREKLLTKASEMMAIAKDKLDIKENRIFVIEEPEKYLTWDKVATEYFSKDGPLVGAGHYSPPKGLGGTYKGAAVGTSPAYSFSASVCEVEVDVETGKVKVLNFWDAHDCGTAINPMNVEGQVDGAAVMGMSETLFENQVFDSKGRMLNPDLHNYLIATSADTPEIHSVIVDSYEPEGPYGAKEVGEGASLPILGAIANAIEDAVGVRIKELPISPEKILKAIRENQNN